MRVRLLQSTKVPRQEHLVGHATDSADDVEVTTTKCSTPKVSTEFMNIRIEPMPLVCEKAMLMADHQRPQDDQCRELTRLEGSENRHYRCFCNDLPENTPIGSIMSTSATQVAN